jgi:hypothetical protein
MYTFIKLYTIINLRNQENNKGFKMDLIGYFYIGVLIGLSIFSIIIVKFETEYYLEVKQIREENKN